MSKSTLLNIAIVGRANVGKSTLFNRLVERDQAMVSDLAGTTRDVNYGLCWWQGRPYQMIDTGGLDIAKPANTIELGIIKQARKALKQADLILFLIDAKTGVLPGDKLVIKQFQSSKKPILLVINKADSLRLRQLNKEIYGLGLGEPNFVSASNGSGVGDLLDVIVAKLPTLQTEPEVVPSIKLAILGKPNVGKSSLLNSLLGEERVIVSEIPHTTREAHYVDFNYEGQNYTLIDTAGIRKKAKVSAGLEKSSVDKSLAAAAKADVVLLVTDVVSDLSTQDKHLTEEIAKHQSSVIILANKWDLATTKNEETIKKVYQYYQKIFSHLTWAPIMFVSAKTGLNVKKIFKLVKEIYEQRHRQLSEEELAVFLKSALRQHLPSKEGHHRLKRGGNRPAKLMVYQIEQSGTNPPRFVLTVNNDQLLHFSLLRFFQNRLREYFKIVGTPIILTTKEKGK
ncbi:MAG: ribosome biogenesis GTPase Der [Candidatus Buchananbacteria bacterium]